MMLRSKIFCVDYIMKNSLYYQQFVMFGLMVAIGVFLNPMNMLIYRFDHFYISLTLIYSGLFMASIMIWAHQILHYLNTGHLNLIISLYGIAFTVITFFLLRKQLFVDEKQYLKRMITHHSTALTTSYHIINNTNDEQIKQLAKDIINTQEREIKLMKSLF
jgi:hypothetical protein